MNGSRGMELEKFAGNASKNGTFHLSSSGRKCTWCLCYKVATVQQGSRAVSEGRFSGTSGGSGGRTVERNSESRVCTTSVSRGYVYDYRLRYDRGGAWCEGLSRNEEMRAPGWRHRSAGRCALQAMTVLVWEQSLSARKAYVSSAAAQSCRAATRRAAVRGSRLHAAHRRRC